MWGLHCAQLALRSQWLGFEFKSILKYDTLGGPESSLTCAQGSWFARCPPVWSLRHRPPPSHFLAELGGDFLLSVPGGGPCPCLMLYVVPMVIDCLFAPLGPRARFWQCHFGQLSLADFFISFILSERCVSLGRLRLRLRIGFECCGAVRFDVGVSILGGPESSLTCAHGSWFARCPPVWSLRHNTLH